MESDRRVKRRCQYLQLGVGELTAVALFIWAARFVFQPRLDDTDTVCLWCAVAPLLVIVLQAGVYWLAARRWVNKNPMPRMWAKTYFWCARGNVLMLAASACGVVAWWPSDPKVALSIAAVWLFAVVEYVNYFVARLSYPITIWWRGVSQWRTPQLMRDVREGLAR